MQPRIGTINRNTPESDVSVTINLDGSGIANIETSVHFFDHMLTAFARQGGFDLDVHAFGAPYVDAHYIVEDTAMILGQAITAAITGQRNVKQLGSALVPVAEALCEAVVDLSGAPMCVFNGEPESLMTAVIAGHYATVVNESFFEALALHAKMTLHVNCRYGREPHHITEAEFRATALALRQAVDAHHT